MTQTRRPKRQKRYDGEGSVFPASDRGWYAQLRVGGRKLRRRASTEELAYEKLQTMRAAVGLGLPTPSGEQLQQFLSWWLRHREAMAQSGKLSTNTVDNARWAVDKWIVPALGTKRLRDLQPDDVEALLENMAALGRSQSTLIRVRHTLAQGLTKAEARGLVARNVARLAEMPATKRPTERRSLTPHQAEALLTAIQGDRLEALFITGLMLGLRPGELTGLRWEDYDDGTLYVEGSLKQERTEPGGPRVLRLGATKTAKSRRPLRVPPPVAGALKVHHKRQTEERLIAGPEWAECGLMFTTPFGTPLDPSNLRQVFSQLTHRAGIGHWAPNELRHSAASLMSAAGMPLEVIADVLGHASTRMLEKHYRHRTKPVIDAHVAVMDGLFGNGSTN